MPEPPPSFRRAFLLSYGLGVVLCVAWPLVLQAWLGRSGTRSGLVEDLGYTFTGLVVLGALFVRRRSRRVREGFAALEASRRPRVMAREILLYSAIFELSAFFGLIYHGLGGLERYARSFLGLATVMFLVFVPGLGAWWRAAQGPAIPERPATDALSK